MSQSEDHSARRLAPDAPRAGVRVGAVAATATLLFDAPDGGIPNNPTLPVILVRGAVTGGANEILALYEASGWRRVWTWTVFDYHHYHPNAHEALTVAKGQAQLQLGGPSGPVVKMTAGDYALLPAGTGHCRISASSDFAICGGYPPDQADRVIIEAGGLSLDLASARISAVSLPETDPIFGADGPAVRIWQGDMKHGA